MRGACDAIQDGTGRRLLEELDDVLAGDRKALPVDHRARGVGNRLGIALGDDGRITADDRSAYPLGVRMLGRKARSNGKRQQLAPVASEAPANHPASPA